MAEYVNSVSGTLYHRLLAYGYTYSERAIPCAESVAYRHLFCNGSSDIYSNGGYAWYSRNHDGSDSALKNLSNEQELLDYFPRLPVKTVRIRVFKVKPMEFRISHEGSRLCAIGCNGFKYEITFVFKETPDGRVTKTFKVSVDGVYVNLDDEFSKRDADQYNLDDIAELCDDINQRHLDDIIYESSGKYNWTID